MAARGQLWNEILELGQGFEVRALRAPSIRIIADSDLQRTCEAEERTHGQPGPRRAPHEDIVQVSNSAVR
ncbi:hypothetical protein GSI_13297 [Ganoderma sinense ZZ0214-1]|uniref:Uncharacterized protein n=1 Tax=Ganoderma sinense ZZ0214-1 TaxID=1077348 RepID=A0A2G8RV67_9APHY|nr:hypothetical protein GSI_13297 [Ganoderma sinense ZZ0214-1]